MTPADIPASPDPTGTAVYVVGWFHTHTPTLNVTFSGRPSGPSPSPGDEAWATDNNLPGLVYDYIGDFFGWIPQGHPINDPAKLYDIKKPERRL